MKAPESFTMYVVTVFLITTVIFVSCDTNVLANTDNGQALVISTTIVPTESTSTDQSVTPGLTESKPEIESLMSVSSGGDGGDNQTGISLKPEIYSFHIDSDILYRYSRTYVTSRVVNRDPTKSQEVTFRVVLPETAFISKFIMEIDGKAYEAYVKEKEEAKKVYNQAQSQGQSAGLVELNTRNANVFDVNVNIKAQAKVNFNLTYEELLSRRLGRYEQSISISPDQILNVKDFQIVVNIEESQNITLLKVPNLRNDIEAQEDSEGNNKDAIIERPAGNKAQIKWTPTEKDQNQLAKQGITGKFLVQYDIKRELDAGEVLVMNGYFVHFFAPENLPALRKHVVFVLDTSGSMWGRKMTQLKEAMSKILADLNPEDYFNILTFSSDVTLWSPEDRSPVTANSNWAPPPFHGEPIPTVLSADPRKRQPYPATVENIERAQRFIQSLVASGGTNIQDSVVQALNLTTAIKFARVGDATNTTETPVQETTTTATSTQAPVTIATGNNSTTTTTGTSNANIANTTEVQAALVVLPPNVESLIIFLTDGEPTVGVTDLSQIQAAIQAANKNISVPLFSLAFGEGADFPFVRKLSLQNNGFARKIYEAADATIQLTGFFNEIASPLLSNITFNYTSSEYSIQNLTLTKFSTVFGGTEIAVAGNIVPKDQATTEPAEDVTTMHPVGSGELLEEVQVEGNQVAPTEKRYFDVEVSGFGRNGHVHFNNPEIFSSPIPWGIPVIKPFPPRPTPVPTQEDLFLERLWAYLTVQQLIEKDFAKQSQENEIPDENQPTTVATTTARPTVVSTITIGNKTIKISTVVPAETPKQKALRLALKYGFVTSLTSLVVVKPNSSDVTDTVSANASPDSADSLAAPQSFNHFQAIKPVHKVKFSAGGQSFTANRIAGLPVAFPAHPAHHQHAAGISSFESFRPVYAQGNPGFGAFGPYPTIGILAHSTNRPGFYYSTTIHHQIHQESESEEDIQPGGYTTSSPSAVSSTTAETIPSQSTTDGVIDLEIVSTTNPTESVHPESTATANVSVDQDTVSTVVAVPEVSSTRSPKPVLNTSTSEPELSPTSPPVSLTLDDLTWFKDSVLVMINGTEIAHRIALNTTIDDTEGSECGDAKTGYSSHCTHLKDCLIPVISDDYELYIKSYFCSIESRQSDVLYAGTCCATRPKNSFKVT